MCRAINCHAVIIQDLKLVFLQSAEEINPVRVRASVRCNICLHRSQSYKNFPALHVSYLDSSWGWLVSFVCPCFLLSSSRFISLQKVVQEERCERVFVLSACLEMNGDEASPSVTAGDSDLDATPSRGDEP